MKTPPQSFTGDDENDNESIQGDPNAGSLDALTPPNADTLANPNQDQPPVNLLGADGEWQPGSGELGPPVDLNGNPTGDAGASGGGTSGSSGGLFTSDDLNQFKTGLAGLISGAGASASSPFLKGAIDAHRVANQRGLDRSRALAAERASVEGTNNSGGFDTNLYGLTNDANRDEADYEGNLVANANDQNEQRRLAALGLFGNLYNTNVGQNLSASEFESSQNQQALLALLGLLQQQGQGAF